MSLFKYFKPVSKSSLPSPNGKLSCAVPSSSLAAANQEVSKLLPVGVTVSIPPSLCMSSAIRADNAEANQLWKNKGSATGLASYKQRYKCLLSS